MKLREKLEHLRWTLIHLSLINYIEVILNILEEATSGITKKATENSLIKHRKKKKKNQVSLAQLVKTLGEF